MLKVEVRNRIKFPDITLQGDLEKIAKDIIIPDIIRGIDGGLAIMGGVLPQNEPETIKRKGHSRQLIETGKLRSSFFYRTIGKSKVIISIKGDRKEIGSYLQEGIETKSGIKQYIFFGISEDAYSNLKEYLRNKIKELTSGKGK